VQELRGTITKDNALRINLILRSDDPPEFFLPPIRVMAHHVEFTLQPPFRPG
jgi:hypothetical protein